MIFRFLQISLWTSLAGEQHSSIQELIPNKSAASAHKPGLAILSALAAGLLGTAMFLSTAAQLFFHNNQSEIAASVEPAVGSPQAVTTQPLDKKGQLMAYATQHTGNAAAGRLVFMGKGCVACHDVPGAGGGMGPDLFGVGSRYSHEMLMKKILEPRVKSGMPTTFADDLSQEEFVNLLAYLRDATPVREDVQ